MFDETQRERITQRIANEIPDVSEAEAERIGNFVYVVSALPEGNDRNLLSGVLAPDSGMEKFMRRAASICFDELASRT